MPTSKVNQKIGSSALPWHLGLLNDSRCNISSTEARFLVAITGHGPTSPVGAVNSYLPSVKPTCCSGFLQPTLGHNQNRPTSTSGLNEKCRSSVDRTRDFSPQSLVVITQEKRALARFLSSSKFSLFLFNPHLPPTGEAVKKPLHESSSIL
ncbi:hypothetical protein AVEN_139675-1 [Araneus ventricosus]|uniref:Uncharacterized protein n=1 Tax=Araneus ventricosus TaxID=182803 RepID=A0A4Y2ND29_ARAVE|nr:hypothetical protein AVEN_139675-1 [Araneus ventricosus]